MPFFYFGFNGTCPRAQKAVATKQKEPSTIIIVRQVSSTINSLTAVETHGRGE